MEQDYGRTVGVRLSRPLASKVEKYRAKLEKDTPGLKASTSDAVRALVEAGIAALENGK